MWTALRLVVVLTVSATTEHVRRNLSVIAKLVERQWRRQAHNYGALGHVPPWSLRMHANFADLTPGGFHFWMTLSPRTLEPVRHAPVPPLEQNSGDATVERRSTATNHESVCDLKFDITETAVSNVQLDVLGACAVAEAQLSTLWLTVGVLYCQFTHLQITTSAYQQHSTIHSLYVLTVTQLMSKMHYFIFPVTSSNRLLFR